MNPKSGPPNTVFVNSLESGVRNLNLYIAILGNNWDKSADPAALIAKYTAQGGSAIKDTLESEAKIREAQQLRRDLDELGFTDEVTAEKIAALVTHLGTKLGITPLDQSSISVIAQQVKDLKAIAAKLGLPKPEEATIDQIINKALTIIDIQLVQPIQAETVRDRLAQLSKLLRIKEADQQTLAFVASELIDIKTNFKEAYIKIGRHPKTDDILQAVNKQADSAGFDPNDRQGKPRLLSDILKKSIIGTRVAARSIGLADWNMVEDGKLLQLKKACGEFRTAMQQAGYEVNDEDGNHIPIKNLVEALSTDRANLGIDAGLSPMEAAKIAADIRKKAINLQLPSQDATGENLPIVQIKQSLDSFCELCRQAGIDPDKPDAAAVLQQISKDAQILADKLGYTVASSREGQLQQLANARQDAGRIGVNRSDTDTIANIAAGLNQFRRNAVKACGSAGSRFATLSIENIEQTLAQSATPLRLETSGKKPQQIASELVQLRKDAKRAGVPKVDSLDNAALAQAIDQVARIGGFEDLVDQNKPATEIIHALANLKNEATTALVGVTAKDSVGEVVGKIKAACIAARIPQDEIDSAKPIDLARRLSAIRIAAVAANITDANTKSMSDLTNDAITCASALGIAEVKPEDVFTRAATLRKKADAVGVTDALTGDLIQIVGSYDAFIELATKAGIQGLTRDSNVTLIQLSIGTDFASATGTSLTDKPLVGVHKLLAIREQAVKAGYRNAIGTELKIGDLKIQAQQDADRITGTPTTCTLENNLQEVTKFRTAAQEAYYGERAQNASVTDLIQTIEDDASSLGMTSGSLTDKIEKVKEVRDSGREIKLEGYDTKPVSDVNTAVKEYRSTAGTILGENFSTESLTSIDSKVRNAATRELMLGSIPADATPVQVLAAVQAAYDQALALGVPDARSKNPAELRTAIEMFAEDRGVDKTKSTEIIFAELTSYQAGARNVTEQAKPSGADTVEISAVYIPDWEHPDIEAVKHNLRLVLGGDVVDQDGKKVHIDGLLKQEEDLITQLEGKVTTITTAVDLPARLKARAEYRDLRGIEYTNGALAQLQTQKAIIPRVRKFLKQFQGDKIHQLAEMIRTGIIRTDPEVPKELRNSFDFMWRELFQGGHRTDVDVIIAHERWMLNTLRILAGKEGSVEGKITTP